MEEKYKERYIIKGTPEFLILGTLLNIPKNRPMKELARNLLFNKIPFEVVHQEFDNKGYVAICSPSYGDDCKIDAIFHPGSYGYNDDLIEIWDFECIDVEGCLTPEEALERFKEVANKNNF